MHRSSKVARIEKVEHFHPELRFETFRDSRVLEDRKVHLTGRWPVKLIARLIGIGASSRQPERGRIEPIHIAAGGGWNVREGIAQDLSKVVVLARSGDVLAGKHGEWRAGVKRQQRI